MCGHLLYRLLFGSPPQKRWGMARVVRVFTCAPTLLSVNGVLTSLLYASETWTLLKADIAKLEAFHMTNQRQLLGILWYEFVTNVEVATLSQLPSINEAISRTRHSLYGHSGVRIRLLLPTKPYISQSRHDRAQDSLVSGGDNRVVRENAGWSRSQRAQGSLSRPSWLITCLDSLPVRRRSPVQILTVPSVD